jgi:hypothetical protein
MPSPRHQWLLVWAVRRMAKDGYVVSGFDGLAPRGDVWNALPTPFVIRGIRPDAWGQRESDQIIAFAEAKTFHDVDTAHTRQQLEILGKVRMKNSKIACPIYIAVPRTAVYELDRVLIDVGLLRARNLVRLHVPDIFLEEASHGSRQDLCTTA